MTNRKKIVVIGVALATVTAGALGVAAAMGGGPHGFFFKRIYGKVVKELDLTPEQKTSVDALKDRVIADFKASKQKGGHEELIAEGKALWLADTFDEARADVLEAKIKAKRDSFHKKVRAAIKELHGILNAEQRAKLVSMMEKFRGKMKGRWKKHHHEGK